MKNCRFSVEARQDLQGIHDYIAAEDPAAALRLVERIEQSCQLLAENPLMGEACDFLTERLRMTAVGNYILFHRPDDDGANSCASDSRRPRLAAIVLSVTGCYLP